MNGIIGMLHGRHYRDYARAMDRVPQDSLFI